MLSKFVDIFKIKELRNRILFTIMILIIFRIGAQIPVPGVNIEALSNYIQQQKNQQGGGANTLLDYFDFFAGGAFHNLSIFSLGIMPYITTSIIMQLLLLVFPALKRMSEEEGGRKKINQYTRIGTVFVCFLQSFMIINQVKGLTENPALKIIVFEKNLWLFYLATVIITTTGTIVLMWLGEKISEHGIGNGISLIIFAGIVARIPSALIDLINIIKNKGIELPIVILVLALYVIIISLVIYEQQGQRKIPVNYAKRVVGRKVYGAPSTYLPLKINPSGVIPIIFASAILSFPQVLFNIPIFQKIKFLQNIGIYLRPTHVVYLILYGLFIIFFAYFYTQVQFNPIEIAKNIREHGGSVPGVPINKLEEYISRVLNRIVLPGSIFLAGIAIVPTLILKLNFPASFAYLLGGTSLLIVVGVDLDTMSQIESYLKMHHKDGLTKKGKIKSRNF